MKLESIAAIAASVILVGCATPPEDEFSIHGAPTYATKSLAMTELVEQLISDPGFSDFYDEALKIAASREHKLPTIAVLPIENNCGAGARDRDFSQVFRELQVALRRTKKFRVVDYRLAKGGGDIDIEESDIGIEPVNVQNYGSYAAPDFRMTCQATKELGGLYFLNAQIAGPDKTIAADGSVRLKNIR